MTTQDFVLLASATTAGTIAAIALIGISKQLWRLLKNNIKEEKNVLAAWLIEKLPGFIMWIIVLAAGIFLYHNVVSTRESQVAADMATGITWSCQNNCTTANIQSVAKCKAYAIGEGTRIAINYPPLSPKVPPNMKTVATNWFRQCITEEGLQAKSCETGTKNCIVFSRNIRDYR